MCDTFTSVPVKATLTWLQRPEDDTTDRWETNAEMANATLNVNVLVPSNAPRRRYLRMVDRAISNAFKHFDANVEYILRWYGSRYPEKDALQFKTELLEAVTLFIDFTESPTKRELIFWKTNLQHLGVPVSSHGRIVPVSGVPR